MSVAVTMHFSTSISSNKKTNNRCFVGKLKFSVASLIKSKSAGVNTCNIPAELVQAGVKTMINVLTNI